jgi:hypothetical protein
MIGKNKDHEEDSEELSLNRETLRTLEDAAMHNANGGASTYCTDNCTLTCSTDSQVRCATEGCPTISTY